MQVTKRKRESGQRAVQSARIAEKSARFPRSRCPVANLLDLVGDKWSLLVVRDMFRGRMTYGKLLDSPERIPTNILAERLRRLEKAGVITRVPYQQRPVRYSYTLTKRGRDLGDILAALVRWGKRHVTGTRTFDG
jgi:DNA-binding HxlR family transcriptional regulator